MLKSILNIAYSLSIIVICLFLGYLLNSALGRLPSSLYGMILFAVMLKLKWADPEKIKKTIQWIITHMGVCFVPAGVGIMNHFDLLKSHGVSIIFIVLFTTLLLITFIGLAHKYYLKKYQE